MSVDIKRPEPLLTHEEREAYTRHAIEFAQQNLSYIRARLLLLQESSPSSSASGGAQAVPPPHQELLDKIDEATNATDTLLSTDLALNRTSFKTVPFGAFDFNVYNDLMYFQQIEAVRVGEMLNTRPAKSLEALQGYASVCDEAQEYLTRQIDLAGQVLAARKKKTNNRKRVATATTTTAVKRQLPKPARSLSTRSQTTTSNKRPPNIKLEHAEGKKRARRPTIKAEGGGFNSDDDDPICSASMPPLIPI